MEIDEEMIHEVINNEVQQYEKSDFSDTVYIYKDLAYIGEQGFDNMVETIKENLSKK